MIKPRIISHDSIVRHLVDGTISIDTTEEYQRLLKLFPRQPVLQRAYADYLKRRKRPTEAIQTYHRATRMFLEERMVLQAIMSILQSWRLRNPVSNETRGFYRSLQQVEITNNLVHCFFKALSYPELIAFMSKLERIQVAPRTVIQKFGASVEGLYFIVSGKINEIPCHSLERYEIGPAGPMAVCRNENDFFGNVPDLGNKTYSQTYIQGTTHVELAFVKNSHLDELCRKFPGFRKQLQVLMERSESATKPNGTTIRRTIRSEVKFEVTVTLMPWHHNKAPIRYQAFATDISLGGACVFLDQKKNRTLPDNLSGAPVTFSLGTANNAMYLNVLGVVSWFKQIRVKGQPTRALGIQFNNMSPKLGGLLVLLTKILSEEYEASLNQAAEEAQKETSPQ